VVVPSVTDILECPIRVFDFMVTALLESLDCFGETMQKGIAMLPRSIRGTWKHSCATYINSIGISRAPLNSRNAKLKYSGDRWGLFDIQIVLHISFKAMYFVL